MHTFEYKGTTSTGQKISGLVQAENQQNAKIRLKKKNIFIFELKNKNIQEKKAWSLFFFKGVNIDELCAMTRQLATLLKSRVPLVESLNAVIKQTPHTLLRMALMQIRNDINEGHAFYKSLIKHPNIFDTTYVSMCEAGENSGTLDTVLLELAEFTEKQAEMKSKIQAALAYPVLMLFFTFFITLFLFTYIIPKITTVFEGEDIVLPWYTTFIMNISQVITNSWIPLLIGFGLIILIFNRWVNTKKGIRTVDTFVLKLPVLGPLIQAAAISRFTRTLATLLKGGVPMLTAMKIIQNSVKNIILKEALEKTHAHVREGESIARPLEESQQFTPMTIQMIKVGEQTGELEDMLLKISDTYDFQVNTKVNTFTSLLGPIMIILISGVVAVIVFSVMVPILQMYNQVS